jgi:hypothetical protein
MRRFLPAVLLALAFAPATAAADPSPTAWQPVISDSAAAIGRYFTITQPTGVTGVSALLPTAGIPATGAGTLAWDASAGTLSWRGGAPVAVDRSLAASYTLYEPGGAARIIAAVTPGALPAANRSDTLTVAGGPATAGLGDELRDTARGSTVFDGDLYIGVENVDNGHVGEVWRTADGLTWVKAAPDAFGQGAGVVEHVDAFIVYGGQLYAGTDNGEIWRTGDGTLWTEATPTPGGVPGVDQNITAFATFDGLLYANQARIGPAGVFDSAAGVAWANVLRFGEPQLDYTHDLVLFDGSLFSDVGSYKGYLGAGQGEIWSSSDGADWHQSGADGFGGQGNTDIAGLAVFGDALFAGTFNPLYGAEVWRTTDGASWQRVASGGFGDAYNTVIQKLTVFDGELYAGTENDHEGGEIWRTADGTDWTLANVPGFGTHKYQRIRSFFTFGGYLYANGENDCEGGLPGCREGGWELWRLEAPPPTCAVSAIRRGSPADQEDVTVQAPGGLAALGGFSIENGDVSTPLFDPGATGPVVVTATKQTQGVPTRWSFDATDEAGQTTHCA